MEWFKDGRLYALLVIFVGAGMTACNFTSAGEALMLLGAGLFQHPTKEDK